MLLTAAPKFTNNRITYHANRPWSASNHTFPNECTRRRPDAAPEKAALLDKPGARSEPANSSTRLKRLITFGRYTGDTPVADQDPDRDKPQDNIEELGELITRSQMRRAPPDILVTNFSMLEYALLRSDDQELFKNPSAFKMLVLDEVHTYSGTLGTEVAMLLRRLTANLSERAGRSMRPIFVGTSATVGSGSGAAKAMAEFASRLFASEFDTHQILLEAIVQPSVRRS